MILRRRVGWLATVGALIFGGAALAGAAPEAGWTLDSGPIDPTHYAGITLANGIIGIVSAPQPFGLQQALIGGAYQPDAAHGTNTLFKGFDFLHLRLVADGEPVEEFARVSNFRQSLDMKRAVLTTTFDFKDKVTVSYTLRALRHLEYNALLEVTVTAHRPVALSVESGLDSGDLLKEVHYLSAAAVNQSPVLAARARTVEGSLLVGAAQTFVFDDPANAPPVTLSGNRPAQEGGESGDDRETLGFTKTLTAGERLHFSLEGATTSSAQVADPESTAQRLTIFAASFSVPKLIAAHEKEWADIWRSDIVIEGDAATQRQVRSMLYHLYAFIRPASGNSIPPMGLSRAAYGGHIFWDAETWMLPALLALEPQFAKSMLDYRFARLDAARRNALAHGFRGAMFPWESAQSGEEDTRVDALGGPLEIHISSDIALAAWNYFRVTQDRVWLREIGYPIISGTADFWASRVERHAPGHFDISHVVAADEYANNATNNAFTNAAARENLKAATAAAKILKLAPDPDWEVVRRNIPIEHFPDGVTREHADYTGETIKQADVTLLSYPLNETREPRAIRRDLRYYEAHLDEGGPSMTKSISAILYERLGEPDRALAMFEEGLMVFEQPPFGVISETTASLNPYFATCAGGLLQSLLYGFGGLRITDAGLVQDRTVLPTGWRSLTLKGVGEGRRTFNVKKAVQ
jgi:kojibiose hydrolase